MASVITATTTSGLTQQADNSGVLQLASGTGNLVTVPSVTGTAMVSGNMPAFSVTNSTNQSYSINTFTKVLFQTKTFDTANCFDNSTNYRYTPNVAGYYMFIAELNHDWGGAAGNAINTNIYKNGSNYQAVSTRGNSGTGPYGGVQASSLIYMNGSTDYVEVYTWSNNGSPSVVTNSSNGATIFSGYLVRAA